jgi:hypothetical protein
MSRIETVGGESACVCQQDRRGWVYGRRRDPRGTYLPQVQCEKKRQALIASLQGLQLDAIKTHAWHIIRCSAMTGHNLEAGLNWVVEDAKKRLFLY